MFSYGHFDPIADAKQRLKSDLEGKTYFDVFCSKEGVREKLIPMQKVSTLFLNYCNCCMYLVLELQLVLATHYETFWVF
jgi:hypothetical protein